MNVLHLGITYEFALPSRLGERTRSVRMTSPPEGKADPNPVVVARLSTPSFAETSRHPQERHFAHVLFLSFSARLLRLQLRAVSETCEQLCFALARGKSRVLQYDPA